MNRKQKIIVSVTGIFVVMLILVGLTYAYFLTQISGNTNTKSISVTTANLALTYGDGNGIIQPTDKLMPNTTVDSKTFTVTNNGNDTTEYVVVIDETQIKDASSGQITTFKTNDFRYTLTCKKKDGTSCNEVKEQTLFPINGGLLINNIIDINEVHTYSLTLTYIETGFDQSDDMNKTFTARVNIKDPKNIYDYGADTLTNKLINNAVTTTDEEEKTKGYAKFRTIPLTKPLIEINNSDEADLSITNDDYGVSYYYRGNVENNYLTFNNMCWRIVRIQGDGSIKIVLADDSAGCSAGTTATDSAFIGTGVYGWNVNYADYINYNGGMRTSFNNFIETRFTTILGKLKMDNWCIGNMRDAYDYNNTGEIVGTIEDMRASYENFKYAAGNRYYVTQKTSLICETTGTPGEIDVNNVGALTMDEVTYAGGGKSPNSNYFLNKNATSNQWWTISTLDFDSWDDGAFLIIDDGYVGNTLVGVESSLRPSITLVADTQYDTGNGTLEASYTIK